MNKTLFALTILTAVFLAQAVLAQNNEVQAGVAISIEQGLDIWTGQQVTLNLDLKTTGFSFSNSHFNIPEVSNAFLMQTDTTTIKMTEKIEGRDWQIVRYPLALYPQTSGQINIPAITVRFSTSAGFGSKEKDFEFATRPMEISVKLPPGANPDAMIVTTNSFELEHEWMPETVATKTGDAVTLTVNRRAGDISAMLLPPLPIFRAEGLGTYQKTAEVRDKTDRGDLSGERVDSITWVIEKPGTYDIPGIRFQWWDPDIRELKQQLIPGLNLHILPSPAEATLAGVAVENEKNPGLPVWILVISMIGLLLGFLWLRYGTDAAGYQSDNEKSAFARLELACKNNHASGAHTAIHTWIIYATSVAGEDLQPVTLVEFACLVNSERLAAELTVLQEALIAPENNWQGDSLLRAVKNIRHEAHHQKTNRSKAYLAPLNP